MVLVTGDPKRRMDLKPDTDRQGTQSVSIVTSGWQVDGDAGGLRGEASELGNLIEVTEGRSHAEMGICSTFWGPPLDGLAGGAGHYAVAIDGCQDVGARTFLDLHTHIMAKGCDRKWEPPRLAGLMSRFLPRVLRRRGRLA